MSEIAALAAREASCLCGAVRFKARPLNAHAGACHCHMCQRFAGGVSMSVAVDPNIEELGEEKISAYKSSAWGERLFCAKCGSSLGFRMQDNSMLMLSTAAFEDNSGFELATEIFIDEKPDFYALAGNAHKMTGEQFLAFLKEQGD